MSGDPGKGANATVSMLHHLLDTHGTGETHLQLHADNCMGQNKNSASRKVGFRDVAPSYPSQPLNVIHDCTCLMLGNMVSSTLRITDFFKQSVHGSKRAKRDDSLPNSPEALSFEGSVIVDISEAENTASPRRLHSPSSEVESTDSVCPQSTTSNESDS